MRNRFKNWKFPEFDKSGMTKWYWRCQHHQNLKLGKSVDIGTFSYLNAKYGIEIGDYVQIGGGVKIYSLDTISNKKGKIILRRNCKIGANSVILPAVIIGENSVIGANSIIKSGTNILSNEIWAGSPVKKIGIIRNGKRIYQ